MATVQDVKEAAQNLQNALKNTMIVPPCSDEAGCVQTAEDIGPQFDNAVGMFVIGDPDPAACAAAVAALDALATTFAESPPIDPESYTAVEAAVVSALQALA